MSRQSHLLSNITGGHWHLFFTFRNEKKVSRMQVKFPFKEVVSDTLPWVVFTVRQKQRVYEVEPRQPLDLLREESKNVRKSRKGKETHIFVFGNFTRVVKNMRIQSWLLHTLSPSSSSRSVLPLTSSLASLSNSWMSWFRESQQRRVIHWTSRQTLFHPPSIFSPICPILNITQVASQVCWCASSFPVTSSCFILSQSKYYILLAECREV